MQLAKVPTNRKRATVGIPAQSRSARAIKPWRFIRQAALAACTSLAVALPSQAETTLKVAHRFPASHYIWEMGGGVFANAVEKASNGQIKFEVYPAAQLGKDYFSLLRSGLADLAIFVPAYESEKLPMSSVAELPGAYTSVCEGTNKYWQLAQEGGILGDGEFKAQNLHVLFVTVMAPYTVLTTSQQTPTLDELSGLKIRANGAAMTKAVRALGAVPVSLTSPELYEALSRGTVDGTIYSYQALPQYNLQDELKYSVDGPRLGGTTVAFAISTKTWNKLSAEEQAILTEAASSTQESLCQWLDADDSKVRERIVAKDGHAISKLSANEYARWDKKLETVTDDWVKEMQQAGRNGIEVLEAYRNAPGTAN